MQGHSIEFKPESAERLFVTVVNQAILDVLENGEEAEEAKRWLLSKDFDVLQSLFQLRWSALTRSCPGARISTATC
jgi:hypothetical protein